MGPSLVYSMILHMQLFSQTVVLAVVTTPGSSSIQDISFAFVGMSYRAGICLLFVYVVHGPTYAAVIKDSSGGCCYFAWIIINLRFFLCLGLCLL